jgi:hypothetical protein
MAKQVKPDFNAEIWSAIELQLQIAELQAFGRLKEVISAIDLPITSEIIAGRGTYWAQNDMAALQSAIAQSVSSTLSEKLDNVSETEWLTACADELKKVSDVLAKVVDLIIRKLGKEAPRPKIFSRLRLERNPFCTDLSEARKGEWNRLPTS